MKHSNKLKTVKELLAPLMETKGSFALQMETKGSLPIILLLLRTKKIAPVMVGQDQQVIIIIWDSNTTIILEMAVEHLTTQREV